MKEEYRLLP